MEDWYLYNQDKFRIAALITASLVLLYTIYKWLIQKWQADVSMRKYAHLEPLPSSRVLASQTLIIEVPVAQDIELLLEQDDKLIAELWQARSEVGQHNIALDMTSYPAGDYTLVMRSDDQQTIRRIHWSGVV